PTPRRATPPPHRGLLREALRRQAVGLRELAREDLVADHEGQLEPLRFREVLTQPRLARLPHRAIVGPHVLAEREGRALARAEPRAGRVVSERVELGLGDPRLHAHGVAEVPSVGPALEGGHVELEQRAEPAVQRAAVLDGGPEAAEAEHHRGPLGHQLLGSGNLTEQPPAHPVARPNENAVGLHEGARPSGPYRAAGGPPALTVY